MLLPYLLLLVPFIVRADKFKLSCHSAVGQRHLQVACIMLKVVKSYQIKPEMHTGLKII